MTDLLTNFTVLIILHDNLYHTITLYTLNLHNLLSIISQSWGEKKAKFLLFTWNVLFYLIKYNCFQFLYIGLLRIAVSTSEMELTTNQQMSLPNWSFSTVLLGQFQLVIFFLQISTAFSSLPIPLSSSDEPPKTSIFHFVGIRTIIQDMLSLWMSATMQISLWVTVATWNICLPCGYALAAHRWQTQGLRAESGPPPCFIQPNTLFLPSDRAELSLNY